MRTALFTGTFDPFTVGHDNIVRRALKLCDRLIIAIGINEHKQCRQTAEERANTIRHLYEGWTSVSVVVYDGLTADLAEREQANFIIRGVRSIKDFEYEREQAEVNRRLTGIETLLMLADPQLSAVSSSIVRELEHFGHDIHPYLP